MHPTLVCFSIFTLALGLAAAGPASAQRMDTPFSDLDVLQVDPGGHPGPRPRMASRTLPPSALEPTLILLQTPDGSAPASDPSFAGMALSSSLGSVAGLLLGFLVGLEAGSWDESSPAVYLGAATLGATGSIAGSSLGAWIVGRDEGVGYGTALAGGSVGLLGGIALEAATGGGAFPAAFVTGQGITTAAISWAFSD